MNLFRSSAAAPTLVVTPPAGGPAAAAPAPGPGGQPAPGAAGAAPTGAIAAADKPPRPSGKVVGWGYVLVVAGVAGAIVLDALTDPAPPSVPEGLTVLILLYVLAQVIERAMEPAVRLTVPADKEQARDQKVAAALSSPTDAGAAQEAADAQRDVDVQRANVAVVVWAVATVAGAFLSALTGAYLLASLGVKGITGWRTGIDVAVTGLAIGAGTKPIHDLITRIDNAKNAAKDPPETR